MAVNSYEYDDIVKDDEIAYALPSILLPIEGISYSIFEDMKNKGYYDVCLNNLEKFETTSPPSKLWGNKK